MTLICQANKVTCLFKSQINQYIQQSTIFFIHLRSEIPLPNTNKISVWYGTDFISEKQISSRKFQNLLNGGYIKQDNFCSQCLEPRALINYNYLKTKPPLMKIKKI